MADPKETNFNPNLFDKKVEVGANKDVIDVESTDVVVESKFKLTLPELLESNIIVTQKAEISFEGYEKLKKIVEEAIENYKGIIISNDDDYAAVKKMRTTLNSYKKTIDDARKNKFKEAVKPANTFVDNMKSLHEVVTELEKEFGEKLQAKDNIVKDAKKKEIVAWFDQCLEQFEGVDFIEFDTIFVLKWLNKDPKIKKVKAIIVELFTQGANDLKIIKLQEDSERVMLEYKANGFNLADAVETVRAKIVAEQELKAQTDGELEGRNLVKKSPVEVNQIKEDSRKRVVAASGSGARVEKVSNITSIKVELEGTEEDIVNALEYIREMTDLKLYQIEEEEN